MPEANDHAEPSRHPAGQPPAERAAGQPVEPQPVEPQPVAPQPEPAPDTSPRASDAERNHAIDRLRSAYVEGRLDQEEFDERSRSALTAKTTGQLERLFVDLPAGYARGAPAERWTGAPGQVVRPGGGGRRVSIAVMSGVERKGNWRVPAESTAFAFMGGVELDLRAATLSGPVTTITAVAFMGGIEIIVPPGIRVESSGFGFMGAWDDRTHDDAAPPGAPVLRVRGFALMGGVEIKTREPRGLPGRQPGAGSA